MVVRDDHDIEQETLLNSLVQTIQHFFGGITSLFAGIEDPRVAAKCDSPLTPLLATGLMMFIYRLGARRQIALQLRNSRGARKMETLFGIEAVPHGDTINDAFEQLDPDQVQEVVCGLVEKLIRNKVLDESLKSVNREFASLSKLQPENRITVRRGKRFEEFSWVNDIDYTDTDGLAHKVHVLQCDRTDTSTDTTSTHRWVGNVKISQDRAMDVADEGGWIRWKIEKEGFNEQKNRGYGLEHAYSKNPIAAKVFYFLLQIAHMISQLLGGLRRS